MNRVIRVIAISVTSVVLMGVSIGPAVAQAERSSRSTPAAEVKVSRDVRLGQFTEAVVTVWARCRSPFVVQEVVIEVSQEGANGSRASDFGLDCDDTWHRIQVSVTTPGGGPFGSGRTTVSARLTVIDPVTGDPLPQGQDSVTVWVHDQAEIRIISKYIRLGADAAVIVPIVARCERPWVVQDLSVGVSQDEGFIFGSTAGDLGVTCDDRWHFRVVRVSSSGEPFGRGLTNVDASFSILDPINFDPVAAGSDFESVWLKARAS